MAGSRIQPSKRVPGEKKIPDFLLFHAFYHQNIPSPSPIPENDREYRVSLHFPASAPTI